MKKIARDHKPSHAFELVETEMEGADHIRTGKLPRHRRQISDIYKKLFTSAETNDLALMTERCKCTETGQSPFVRAVQAAPQPICVLSTELQLKQVNLCCTDPDCFSVLSVDPTFNLGSVYVTPLVFLHKAFVSKCFKKSPVFLDTSFDTSTNEHRSIKLLCLSIANPTTIAM